MSLTDNQVDQLDQSMENNQREMVVVSMEDALAMTAERNGSSSVMTQAPQVCSRTQPNMLDGLGGGGGFIYLQRNYSPVCEHHVGRTGSSGRLRCL